MKTINKATLLKKPEIIEMYNELILEIESVKSLHEVNLKEKASEVNLQINELKLQNEALSHEVKYQKLNNEMIQSNLKSNEKELKQFKKSLQQSILDYIKINHPESEAIFHQFDSDLSAVINLPKEVKMLQLIHSKLK